MATRDHAGASGKTDTIGSLSHGHSIAKALAIKTKIEIVAKMILDGRRSFIGGD
ncbi:MAG TPA: hypothetical protein VFP82_01385 [Chthoniobacterales bacterium]|nr:hypothetical protein [Chthoniobacterales bacterium]